jgi:hypothetical protein
MPAVIADCELVRAIGGFDEQQRFGENHDFCLRLALQSEAVAVHEPLCWVRAHDEHYSGDLIAVRTDWMRLYEKMARLTPDIALQDYCARMRSETSLQLARLRGDRDGYAAIWSTLRAALVFSWRYPEWWVGALKRIAGPALRAVLPSALPRSRG